MLNPYVVYCNVCICIYEEKKIKFLQDKYVNICAYVCPRGHRPTVCVVTCMVYICIGLHAYNNAYGSRMRVYCVRLCMWLHTLPYICLCVCVSCRRRRMPGYRPPSAGCSVIWMNSLSRTSSCKGTSPEKGKRNWFHY